MAIAVLYAAPSLLCSNSHPPSVQGSRRCSHTCSSHQQCRRQDCFLNVSNTSVLPFIIIWSINSLLFCAVLFCSNVGHSFSNTKLDELGLLGSSVASLHSRSAGADLPASRCVLPRFTHTMGGETPSLLCWRLQQPPALCPPHPLQALRSPWQQRLLVVLNHPSLSSVLRQL